MGGSLKLNSTRCYVLFTDITQEYFQRRFLERHMAPGQEALNPQVIQCQSFLALSSHYQTHKAGLLFPIKIKCDGKNNQKHYGDHIKGTYGSFILVINCFLFFLFFYVNGPSIYLICWSQHTFFFTLQKNSSQSGWGQTIHFTQLTHRNNNSKKEELNQPYRHTCII